MRNIIFCFFWAVLIVLSVSNEAHSQSERWLLFGKENSGIYLDTATISYKGAKGYRVYTRIQRSDDPNIYIHLCYFSCIGREVKYVSTDVFDESENFLEHFDRNDTYNILPESSLEEVFNYLCK